MMEIKCAECESENLVRDPDAPKSADIAMVCRDCGWRGRRTPTISCPRCASPDLDETAVDGWAYADLDEAREDPESAAWGYVDKAVYTCKKCRYRWTVTGEFRPYTGDQARRSSRSRTTTLVTGDGSVAGRAGSC
jgi:DNA-directed RNA polymerase subunit RPC12/RpoP